jgi:hypothetical protein
METNKKKKLDVEAHWPNELAKLQAWLTGFKMGRRSNIPDGSFPLDFIPGEEVVRQIRVAISDLKK